VFEVKCINSYKFTGQYGGKSCCTRNLNFPPGFITKNSEEPELLYLRCTGSPP
jgi:hypothetical protein